MCKGITLVFLTNDKVQKSKRLDINHTFYRIKCLLETTDFFFQIEIIMKGEVILIRNLNSIHYFAKVYFL